MKEYTKEEKLLIKTWYKKQDVKKLVAFFFNRHLPRDEWLLPTKGQRNIIRKVLYGKKLRALVTAPTRYGKSQWLTIGASLRILFSKDRKMYIMAPTDDKTKIIRDYLLEAIMLCPELKFLLDTDKKGEDKITKEASKKRMTFKNGCMIQTMSLQGDGGRLMGWGVGRNGGDIYIDEIAEVQKQVITKIVRMLADNLENSNLFGLMNPWSKETAAYDLWCNPDYENIFVSLEEAIEEGRLDPGFVESQRRDLTEYEFTVLYESKFPENAVTSVASFDDLLKSATTDIEVTGNTIDYGYDHARFGDDKCVLYRKQGNKVTDRFVWAKKKTPYLAGEIGNFVIRDLADGFNVNFSYDNALSGAGGVPDLIEERVINKSYQDRFFLYPIDNASNATDDLKFGNIITELYFQIADNLNKIQIWNSKDLFKDFSTRLYEYKSNGQKVLESKKTFKKRQSYSPDDGDAMGYCFYPNIGMIGEADLPYQEEDEDDFAFM